MSAAILRTSSFVFAPISGASLRARETVGTASPLIKAMVFKVGLPSLGIASLAETTVLLRAIVSFPTTMFIICTAAMIYMSHAARLCRNELRYNNSDRALATTAPNAQDLLFQLGGDLRPRLAFALCLGFQLTTSGHDVFATGTTHWR